MLTRVINIYPSLPPPWVQATGLLAAIKQANEVGIAEDAKEMTAAKEALSALGAQSEALLKLEEAVGKADIPGIDAALKECDKMGLGDEEVVVQARDAKKRISKQNKAAAALEASLEGSDKEAIKAALAVSGLAGWLAGWLANRLSSGVYGDATP